MHMNRISFPLKWLAAVAALAFLSQAADAAALDGYRDRKGAFMGLGVGGGAAFQGGEVGGDAGFDLEVGGGAAKWLTLSLDLDTRMQHVAGFTNWMFVPGVQADVIILNALVVSAGVGIAFVFPDEELMPDDDFTMGFDGMLGLGYEFFVGSDVAIDIGLEADLIAVDHMDNVITVGIWLGFRYY
jgi:hypothetical protein